MASQSDFNITSTQPMFLLIAEITCNGGNKPIYLKRRGEKDVLSQYVSPKFSLDFAPIRREVADILRRCGADHVEIYNWSKTSSLAFEVQFEKESLSEGFVDSYSSGHMRTLLEQAFNFYPPSINRSTDNSDRIDIKLNLLSPYNLTQAKHNSVDVATQSPSSIARSDEAIQISQETTDSWTQVEVDKAESWMQTDQTQAKTAVTESWTQTDESLHTQLGAKQKIEFLDLLTMLAELDWYELGLYLGVPKTTLDHIMCDHYIHGRKRCKIEMLESWQDNATNQTWDYILKAVVQMGNLRVAGRIAENYGLSIECFSPSTSDCADVHQPLVCIGCKANITNSGFQSPGACNQSAQFELDDKILAMEKGVESIEEYKVYLGEKLEKEKAEKEELQIRLSQYEQTIHELEWRVFTANNILKHTEQALEDMKNKKQVLKIQIKSKQNEIDAKQDKIVGLKSELFKTEIEAKYAKLALEKELITIKQEKKTLEEQKKEFDEQIRSLELKLTKTKWNAEHTRRTLLDEQKVRKELEFQIQTKLNEIMNISEKLKKVEQMLESTRAVMHQLNKHTLPKTNGETTVEVTESNCGIQCIDDDDTTGDVFGHVIDRRASHTDVPTVNCESQYDNQTDSFFPRVLNWFRRTRSSSDDGPPLLPTVEENDSSSDNPLIDI